MRHDIVFILGILILFTGMSSAAVTTTFVSPTANTSTFQNNLLVNATTNMTTIVNLTIRVYASINGTLMNTSQSATSPNFRNYSTLINGMPYLFNATADNATAHVSTETRNITIDKINPRILIYSPTSNTSLNATNSTNILINVTSSDININNMTLSVYNYYGGLIYNITNSTIITTITDNPNE